jgi:hypothetical protein
MKDLDFWFDLISVKSFVAWDVAWQSVVVLTEISVGRVAVYSREGTVLGAEGGLRRNQSYS